MARRGYRTTALNLSGEKVPVRASARVSDALRELTANTPLYEGVKLLQVLEAVYVQGRKDGARVAFEQVERGLTAARKEIPHRTPGRPKKR